MSSWIIIIIIILSMAVPFSCAVLTGGAGGKGVKVIIAGRTESNLRATAQEIGATDYYLLDTGEVDKIPSFVSSLLQKYPDLDCLINNAGVQRPLQVLKDDPTEFLLKADQEININIRGPMHLTLALIDHFKRRVENGSGATIVNVSSVLGFVPFSVINPVYNGTKAWLHSWTVNLRTQLIRSGFDKIKVIEIAPPAVESDLHREREDPDDNKKHKNPAVLTIEEFMEVVSAGLEPGDDVIAPGTGKEIVDKWYEEFGTSYERLS
ncbi:steroid dehydrogenase, putative [Talaromyces stipitatus ATCC 10500]|uniref:Steroid dehydrogenase, putative n=1 Tax=Talaromyces stipitatus (strain ATCC 10500 / CBS 375.48 / QM 6759 / NRRL 1006) TaxID=441959 RepID=B8MQ79_TALSN|nr:steroid dehydrogenase, putative [Talaromyces stipitatus ATCC 10500]EED13148.1 steroid dehydrogenase, putative [Talaromyces stipitatus ATCC 10500]